jgi:hypothetical protein
VLAHLRHGIRGQLLWPERVDHGLAPNTGDLVDGNKQEELHRLFHGVVAGPELLLSGHIPDLTLTEALHPKGSGIECGEEI